MKSNTSTPVRQGHPAMSTFKARRGGSSSTGFRHTPTVKLADTSFSGSNHSPTASAKTPLNAASVSSVLGADSDAVTTPSNATATTAATAAMERHAERVIASERDEHLRAATDQQQQKTPDADNYVISVLRASAGGAGGGGGTAASSSSSPPRPSRKQRLAAHVRRRRKETPTDHHQGLDDSSATAASSMSVARRHQQDDQQEQARQPSSDLYYGYSADVIKQLAKMHAAAQQNANSSYGVRNSELAKRQIGHLLKGVFGEKRFHEMFDDSTKATGEIGAMESEATVAYPGDVEDEDDNDDDDGYDSDYSGDDINDAETEKQEGDATPMTLEATAAGDQQNKEDQQHKEGKEMTALEKNKHRGDDVVGASLGFLLGLGGEMQMTGDDAEGDGAAAAAAAAGAPSAAQIKAQADSDEFEEEIARVRNIVSRLATPSQLENDSAVKKTKTTAQLEASSTTAATAESAENVNQEPAESTTTKENDTLDSTQKPSQQPPSPHKHHHRHHRRTIPQLKQHTLVQLEQLDGKPKQKRARIVLNGLPDPSVLLEMIVSEHADMRERNAAEESARFHRMSQGIEEGDRAKSGADAYSLTPPAANTFSQRLAAATVQQYQQQQQAAGSSSSSVALQDGFIEHFHHKLQWTLRELFASQKSTDVLQAQYNFLVVESAKRLATFEELESSLNEERQRHEMTKKELDREKERALVLFNSSNMHQNNNATGTPTPQEQQHDRLLLTMTPHPTTTASQQQQQSQSRRNRTPSPTHSNSRRAIGGGGGDIPQLHRAIGAESDAATQQASLNSGRRGRFSSLPVASTKKSAQFLASDRMMMMMTKTTTNSSNLNVKLPELKTSEVEDFTQHRHRGTGDDDAEDGDKTKKRSGSPEDGVSWQEQSARAVDTARRNQHEHVMMQRTKKAQDEASEAHKHALQLTLDMARVQDENVNMRAQLDAELVEKNARNEEHFKTLASERDALKRALDCTKEELSIAQRMKGNESDEVQALASLLQTIRKEVCRVLDVIVLDKEKHQVDFLTATAPFDASPPHADLLFSSSYSSGGGGGGGAAAPSPSFAASSSVMSNSGVADEASANSSSQALLEKLTSPWKDFSEAWKTQFRPLLAKEADPDQLGKFSDYEATTSMHVVNLGMNTLNQVKSLLSAVVVATNETSTKQKEVARLLYQQKREWKKKLLQRKKEEDSKSRKMEKALDAADKSIQEISKRYGELQQQYEQLHAQYTDAAAQLAAFSEASAAGAASPPPPAFTAPVAAPPPPGELLHTAGTSLRVLRPSSSDDSSAGDGGGAAASAATRPSTTASSSQAPTYLASRPQTPGGFNRTSRASSAAGNGRSSSPSSSRPPSAAARGTTTTTTSKTAGGVTIVPDHAPSRPASSSVADDDLGDDATVGSAASRRGSVDTRKFDTPPSEGLSGASSVIVTPRQQLEALMLSARARAADAVETSDAVCQTSPRLLLEEPRFGPLRSAGERDNDEEEEEDQKSVQLDDEGYEVPTGESAAAAGKEGKGDDDDARANADDGKEASASASSSAARPPSASSASRPPSGRQQQQQPQPASSTTRSGTSPTSSPRRHSRQASSSSSSAAEQQPTATSLPPGFVARPIVETCETEMQTDDDVQRFHIPDDYQTVHEILSDLSLDHLFPNFKSLRLNDEMIRFVDNDDLIAAGAELVAHRAAIFEAIGLNPAQAKDVKKKEEVVVATAPEQHQDDKSGGGGGATGWWNKPEPAESAVSTAIQTDAVPKVVTRPNFTQTVPELELPSPAAGVTRSTMLPPPPPPAAPTPAKPQPASQSGSASTSASPSPAAATAASSATSPEKPNSAAATPPKPQAKPGPLDKDPLLAERDALLGGSASLRREDSMTTTTKPKGKSTKPKGKSTKDQQGGASTPERSASFRRGGGGKPVRAGNSTLSDDFDGAASINFTGVSQAEYDVAKRKIENLTATVNDTKSRIQVLEAETNQTNTKLKMSSDQLRSTQERLIEMQKSRDHELAIARETQVELTTAKEKIGAMEKKLIMLEEKRMQESLRAVEDLKRVQEQLEAALHSDVVDKLKAKEKLFLGGTQATLNALKSLATGLCCPTCYEPIREAVIAVPCSHVFCRKCVEEYHEEIIGCTIRLDPSTNLFAVSGISYNKKKTNFLDSSMSRRDGSSPNNNTRQRKQHVVALLPSREYMLESPKDIRDKRRRRQQQQPSSSVAGTDGGSPVDPMLSVSQAFQNQSPSSSSSPRGDNTMAGSPASMAKESSFASAAAASLSGASVATSAQALKKLHLDCPECAAGKSTAAVISLQGITDAPQVQLIRFPLLDTLIGAFEFAQKNAQNSRRAIVRDMMVIESRDEGEDDEDVKHNEEKMATIEKNADHQISEIEESSLHVQVRPVKGSRVHESALRSRLIPHARGVDLGSDGDDDGGDDDGGPDDKSKKRSNQKGDDGKQNAEDRNVLAEATESWS